MSDSTASTVNRLLVTGGRQRKQAMDLQEWFSYDQATILQIDPATGSGETVIHHVTPTGACAEEMPSVVFKAGTVLDNELYVCTRTEVLRFDMGTFQRTGYVTHPWMNDLHHVQPRDKQRLLVANTGLDLVMEIDWQAQVLDSWNVADTETWQRFDRQTDYRLIPTTKPHACHVNYVFQAEDQVWATRFHQKDAVLVQDPRKTIDIQIGGPHDGIVRGDRVYFTTINGWIVIADLATGQVKQRIDLNQIHTREEALGWCRGLWLVNDQQAWVGFSRIRPTRFRENLSWIKHGFKKVGLYGMLPTRIAHYDLQRMELMQEIDLETFGLNAVFGIYPVTAPVAKV